MITLNLRYLLLLWVALPFFACQQGASQEEKKQETASTSAYLQAQTGQMLNQYFVLKDALVATDASQGQEAARGLQDLLEAVEPAQIEAAEKATYTQHADALLAAVGQMADTTDIEVQRAAFEQVTAEVLALVKAFDPSDSPVYYQYCPMAFDFKGAHWLSGEKEIMNPYFGDKMLHCGKVEETL